MYALHETMNLFKKWTIARPFCFSPKADHVAHGFKTKKKKEYKDDFFKSNIDSVAIQPV
jgi:hypothetical protein